MADYMDDLFHKIKSKKGKKGEDAEPQKKPVEQPIPEPKPVQQPSPAAKPVSDTTKKLMDEVKKAEETIEEPISEEKPEHELNLKLDAVAEKKEPVSKPFSINNIEIPAEHTQAQILAKENDEAAKKAEEAKKKIEEIKKALPPQEKVLPDSVDAVPEEQKSQTEKQLQKSNKKLLEEYGNTKIYEIPGEPLLYYWTPVPRPVGSEKTIIKTIKEAATRIVSITPYRIRNQEQRRNVYYEKILEILRDSPELNIPKTRYEFYADAVVREMVGYGLIDDLIKDDKLEEIMVIGPKLPVYVFHREHEMMLTNIEFYSDNEIQDLINRIARQIGRRVDISSPLLDARLPDGSRVNATIPPSSVQGSTLTIRKFRDDPYSIIDLIIYGTLNAEAAAFLWVCVEGLNTRPANILIAGGTGSGKTTTLNVLASFIPETERIISIEDTAELNIPLKHWIRMEARPPGLEGTGELTLDILTKNSLRMRPDRIIVGEIRHDEAFSLFTAFNTGHDGCLTGNTKIALTSGLRSMDEFVEEQLSKNKIRREKDWEVCEVKNEYINSMDSDGKIFKSEIVEARRKPYQGKVYHIKLASGAEITATGNHPFYTLDNDIIQVNAEKLVEGISIATPRTLIRDENVSEKEIEYWSGLLHGDGNILDYQRIRKKNGKEYLCNEGRISLFAEEEQIIPKFTRFMKEKLNDTHVGIVYPRPEKDCYEAHVSGIEKSRTIQKLLDIPAGDRAKTKMSNSHYTSDLKSFVAGFFDAEGHIDAENNAIVFTCGNEYYIDFFKYALLTEGIISRKYESKSHNSRWFRLYIYGISQVKKFYETYPIKYEQKIAKTEELLRQNKKANTNVDLINCNDIIINLLEKAKQKGYSNSEIARRAGVTQGLISFYKRKERTPSREVTLKLAEAFEETGIDTPKLRMLGKSDIFWDKIVAIHSYHYNGFVYDLTINEKKMSGRKPHNFVAEGMIVGNSLGTVHANSPQETIVRVTSPPMNVPEVMLSGLNFIVVQHRLHDKKTGTIRRITEISEVVDVLKGKAKTELIYSRDAKTDSLKKTKTQVKYLQLLATMTGISEKEIEKEIEKRTEFLLKLAKQKIRKMSEVAPELKKYLFKGR
ncbi:MAG: ATPase, T2SS/T4P/T4SS family [Candidatus Diapherotrites archaeon]